MGFLGGGISGVLVLIAAIMITGSDFGLDSVRPGALIGSIIGAVVGFFSRGRALKVLAATTPDA
jgi:hypothetical protein